MPLHFSNNEIWFMTANLFIIVIIDIELFSIFDLLMVYYVLRDI